LNPVASNNTIDPVELAAAMIRCPSVTPADEGALDVLQDVLNGLGFTCHRLEFSEPGTPDVENLYARIGDGGSNFCFAGHTDVVPVGDEDAWSVGPFEARIVDDTLYGRGAADMKGAVACFAVAAQRLLAARGVNFGGSISLLITGDEEGDAINGTPKVLGWLKDQGEALDVCLVGEPTNTARIGDTIKIGRRGSMNVALTVNGISGHAAYPELADNPVHRLILMLADITAAPLDDGTDHFPASQPVVTSIDVGNTVTNVIPAAATARFNIRFNDLHSGDSLEKLLRQRFDAISGPGGGDYDLAVRVSGEPFLTAPGPLSAVIADAAQAVTGTPAEFSTSGGTSDARFIKDHCPVAEFGMINDTAHKANESAGVNDISMLSDIYQAVLDRFFADNS